MSKGMPEVLLAKSVKPGVPPVTLDAHCLAVEHAAQEVFRLDGRWGRAWCRFFKLAKHQETRFLLNLRVASLLHDLGKANEDFLAAVKRETQEPQTLRHEHLTALVLHLPQVRAWLSASPDIDVEVVTAAVLSHHVKAARGEEWQWCQPQGLKKSLVHHLSHAQVRSVLGRIADIASLSAPPHIPPTAWIVAPPWQTAFMEGTRTATRFGRTIREDLERAALLLAVKAGLMVADAVASGLVRVGKTLDEWIENVVHAPPISNVDIHSAIIGPRTKSVAERTKKPFVFHRFQDQAAQQPARTLLLAGCGAGKTLAAWRWAQAQSARSSVGRVIFLYPTRGTANEGFKDYVGWAPEDEAALVHATSAYELQAMAANPSEATRNKHYEDQEAARLFALGLWPRRYFSATVDQFLSFMEHRYESLCLLPVLADSALIVDEVHSFDRRMFANLVNFLKRFDVPVLCMTATLPESRRQELAACGLTVFPSEQDRTELKDLERLEGHPRYTIEQVSGAPAALERAVAAYQSGLRVLWVVNTVQRCQDLARQLEAQLGSVPLCYHSRFRLKDRFERHQQTVAAFQQKDVRAIAVTTQVCEMSLDLDADLLISEVAPVPSLVQRFGRANRHLARGEQFRAAVLTYPPERVLPYAKEELEAANRFLAELAGGAVSQRDLALGLEKYGLPEPRCEDSGRFLDSGYYATPGSLRDADGVTVSCVLDADLAQLKTHVDAHKPFDGLVLPAPKSQVDKMGITPPDWLPRHLSVVPAGDYHTSLGLFARQGGES